MGSDEAMTREAMAAWWRREAQFPKFVRRGPDILDKATGSWERAVSAWETTYAREGRANVEDLFTRRDSESDHA